MLHVPSLQIRLADTVSPDERGQVRQLRDRAANVDGVSPLSEQFLLDLASPPGRVRHVLAYAAERVVGYAQLADVAASTASAELVVDPGSRRHGVGRQLLDRVLTEADGARIWAHGNLPAAAALASAADLTAVRELHKMLRGLVPADAEPSATALPDGFRARTFVRGKDEQAWLATNAAAFAHHPEQGRITLADLEERMTLPWFDPAGFILVEADDAPGEVAAFHWTKVEPTEAHGRAPGGEAREASHSTGEVYVVGVHPAYQGRGLGRPVTALGLAHLARIGLPRVVLYVDGDNGAAMRTYSGLGFRSIMVDVMYSRTVHQPLSG
jgi:mycothiol synthase